MRDAMGGTVALVIITVFIVIALGYMAFNVNYTKAFRMKNKIIAVYEDYDGKCDSKCDEIIGNYADSLGYTANNNFNCGAGYYKGYKNLYCYKQVSTNTNISGDGVVEDSKKYYYKIITSINIEIPIINNMLGLSAFSITGDTRSFKE